MDHGNLLDRERPPPPVVKIMGMRGEDQFYMNIAYRFVRYINTGTFGVVSEVKFVETNEVAALKKVREDRRYKNREVEIMRKLKHPNVVALKYYFFTSGNASKRVYSNLILEYLPESLADILRRFRQRRQSVPFFTVKLYMYQLFRGLAHIHSKSVCHRDIKPDNILVNSRTGVLKLCDFGSAKELTDGHHSVFYICARNYRAPELAFGNTSYTVGVDVWSAGCILVELFIGIPLFRCENVVELLYEIIQVLGSPSPQEVKAMNPRCNIFRMPPCEATPWSQVFPFTTPREAVELCKKLLQFAPSSRPKALEACADEFFAELRQPGKKLPSGAELPPLFDFAGAELSCEALLQRLRPQEPAQLGHPQPAIQ